MVDLLASPRLWIFGLWVAAVLFVHFRSRARLIWQRQIVDHSTFLAPLNSLIYLAEGRGVRRGPFFPLAKVPSLGVLVDEWRTIRDEARALLAQGLCTESETRQDLAFNTFFRRGWTRFYVKWYGDELPSAKQACPRTVELLRRVPAVRAALFAVLPPGGKLGRHRDPYAGSLRFHLGLMTPNDDACWIEVDGERYSWRDGEGVLFDETFVHRARNDTDHTRVILFCDVARPIRFAPLRWLERFLARRVLRITQSRNRADESLGAANYLSGAFFRLSKSIRKLRTLAPLTYRVVKYALLAALVGWLVFG